MVRVTVVGAGAIGGVTAGFMANAGEDVELVCKHPELAELISTHGINISGANGKHIIKSRAVTTPDQLSGKKDVIFLATKAIDVEKAAVDIQPVLHENSVIVTMQNGIVEDLVGEFVGRNRVIGCVVHFGVSNWGEGIVEQTSHGQFIIGELDGGITERVQTVKRLLSHIEPVKITQNIYGSLYTKLVINSCINSLGALCGLYLGQMLSRKDVRELFMGIANEAVVVARKAGIVPEAIGRLNTKSLTGSPSFKKHLLIRFIGWKYRHVKSSSLQSLERGHKTEIGFLNGFIVHKAHELGMEVPINRTIVGMIKEIETGERPIHVTNIDELYRSVRKLL